MCERVMMTDLEIKLGKEVWGKSRKIPRHSREKMETVDYRCQWG